MWKHHYIIVSLGEALAAACRAESGLNTVNDTLLEGQSGRSLSASHHALSECLLGGGSRVSNRKCGSLRC
jgi:hypothetical protein